MQGCSHTKMLGGGDQILEISIEYEHIFMHL